MGRQKKSNNTVQEAGPSTSNSFLTPEEQERLRPRRELWSAKDKWKRFFEVQRKECKEQRDDRMLALVAYKDANHKRNWPSNYAPHPLRESNHLENQQTRHLHHNAVRGDIVAGGWDFEGCTQTIRDFRERNFGKDTGYKLEFIENFNGTTGVSLLLFKGQTSQASKHFQPRMFVRWDGGKAGHPSHTGIMWLERIVLLGQD